MSFRVRLLCGHERWGEDKGWRITGEGWKGRGGREGKGRGEIKWKEVQEIEEMYEREEATGNLETALG